MSDDFSAAPVPSYRLIPSQFPPIGLFDSVSTAADLAAVMELAGWTNDRLVADRLARLPQSEWVYGRANSSVAMASFLHAATDGLRFNGPDLGAWYASATVTTAIVEIAHHLRREAAGMGAAHMRRTYRTYSAQLDGAYLDLRGQAGTRADLYDPGSYVAGQAFGEGLRARGGDGIVFDSLRHLGGQNVVGYRPTKVLDVVQTDHFEIAVETAAPGIEAKRLTLASEG